MSLAFSYTDAEQKLADWPVDKTVRHLLAEHKLSMQEVSELIGKNESFIKQQLRRKTISLPLLYALTIHLKKNMFEPLLSLLPEHLQGTRREAALQAEIDGLKAELAAMTKERDIYRDVAVGK